MRRSHSYQTRLLDFEEERPPIPKAASWRREPTGRLWTKTIRSDEEWIVCDFDGTVFLAQVEDDTILAYGQRAVCRWCGGPIKIRGNKVFCEGACKTYQGRISRDLNDYLRWGGARSFTLQREIAAIEHLELLKDEQEYPTYAADWSELDEFVI
ncbi:MAG: hypothetical protein K9W43_13235 [Candidatus Thorarchaeota archaeon]|nr:hypothetical protein [Candidatus Thorarchaeota archaeon]